MSDDIIRRPGGLEVPRPRIILPGTDDDVMTRPSLSYGRPGGEPLAERLAGGRDTVDWRALTARWHANEVAHIRASALRGLPPLEPTPWMDHLGAARMSRCISQRPGVPGDLRGRNLHGMDLRTLVSGSKGPVNIRDTDCRGADFSGADLTRVRFQGANCRGANFSRADLTGADLRGVDLRGANLSGASLAGAILLLKISRSKLNP